MDELINMLRTILMDFGEVYQEGFVYKGVNTFYLTEPHITEVEKILVNDEELESGAYFVFDDSDNSVTIYNATLTEGDVIKIFAKKYKYDTQELDSYIRQALLYVAIGYKNFDVVSGNELYPVPTSEEKKLIVLVASILAKPDYTEYRLPTVTVRYTKNLSLEEKINMLINRYVVLTGIWDYITIVGYGVTGEEVP